MTITIVELAAESNKCAFDQPCKFGHRVEGHAVYCHADYWSDSPRKCLRTWYSGGEIKDEDCPGFQSNPAFYGEINPTPIMPPLCKKCKGSKLIPTDGKEMETCDRCMGDGSDPKIMKLSQYEQDTLEMGTTWNGSMSGKHSGISENYTRVSSSRVEFESIQKLDETKLIKVRQMSFAGEHTIWLIQLTTKGDAVMRANWAARKE